MARDKITYERGEKRYYLGDKEVSREEFDAAHPSRLAEMFAAGRPPSGHLPAAWPMKSEAMAVHPAQIPEVMERNKRHGLAVEYDPTDGCPILRDRGQRRDLMKVEGFLDKDGGYGDDHGPSPQDPRQDNAGPFVDPGELE